MGRVAGFPEHVLARDDDRVGAEYGDGRWRTEPLGDVERLFRCQAFGQSSRRFIGPHLFFDGRRLDVEDQARFREDFRTTWRRTCQHEAHIRLDGTGRGYRVGCREGHARELPTSGGRVKVIRFTVNHY